MEIINQSNTLREDKQLLVVTHLTQLLTYITGFGGLIVPLVLWLTGRDKVAGMDEQGKDIINFQLSLLLYTLICIPLIFLFFVGIIGFIIIGIISFVFPIVGAVNANNGINTKYPLTIRFIS